MLSLGIRKFVMKTSRQFLSHDTREIPETDFGKRSKKIQLIFKILTTAVSSTQMVSAGNEGSFYELWPYAKPYDIMKYINEKSDEGDLKSVLVAMDTFADAYPMYKLSRKKVKLLQSIIVECKPKNILEIGTFFGYSAINIAEVMPADCILTCIEANSENVIVAKEMLTKAFGKNSDILDRINIITGISTDVIQSQEWSSNLKAKIDFLFLDHDKDCYLRDLIILENKNMLDSKRCLVVADNVIFPGAPGYLEHVGYVGATTELSEKTQVLTSATIVKSNPIWIWKTRLEYMPFERVGFETKFSEVKDAMSISQLIINQ